MLLRSDILLLWLVPGYMGKEGVYWELGKITNRN